MDGPGDRQAQKIMLQKHSLIANKVTNGQITLQQAADALGAITGEKVTVAVATQLLGGVKFNGHSPKQKRAFRREVRQEFPAVKATPVDCTKKNVQLLEGARIRSHERRTHLGFTPKPYTAEEWQALCDRHDNRCVRCGCDGPLTVDHILPVSQGGLNNIENIQPLCRSCNSSKGIDDTDYRAKEQVQPVGR